MAERLTRGEIQDLLVKFSTMDPRYRAALLKNPKAVLEGQLNTRIPDSITIRAVEETPDTIYIVVPYVPSANGELGDAALEVVSGGKGDSKSNYYDCHGAVGGQNTRTEYHASVSLF